MAKANKANKASGKASKGKKASSKASEGPKGTPGVFGAGSTKEMLANGTPIGNIPIPRHLQSKVGAKDVRDGGAKYGLKTGLRMTHFCDALFIHNATKRAVDTDLQATLAAEFPKRQGKGAGVQGVPTIQAVSAYRAYFNGEKHGFNSGPTKYKSVSYRADGTERGSESPAPKGKGKGKASK